MTKFKLFTWALLICVLASLLFISGCIPAQQGTPAPGATSSGFDWTFLIFVVVIIVIFYFLMIRPQNNRRKQQQKLLSELKPGDQIITTSGIYGEIDSLDDESAVIKIESGAKIRISRSTIAGKRPGTY